MTKGRKPCPNKCDSEGMLYGGVCAGCGGKGWILDKDFVPQAEIKGEPRGQIDEKRVKLSGVSVSSQCVNCERIVKNDLGRDGLDYPVMNKPFEFGFWCSDCDHEWDVKLVLKVSLAKA